MATEEEWVNLSKLLYECYIYNGSQPKEATGIKIVELAIKNHNVNNLEVTLPGAEAIMEYKDVPVFQKLDFWTCEKGILYPRFIQFCSLIVLNDETKTRLKKNWSESVVRSKSSNRVNTSIIF